MKPFVKWAGGKRQILKRINEFINDSIQGEKNENYTYIEPFLGGGAVFFDRRPKRAIINDLNSDLINAYEVIKSDKYIELIIELKKHAEKYKKNPDEHYYDVRAWDREDAWLNKKNKVQRAARMIFLNRTCYNGLYRVNSKGQFNTPIGRYNNPTICDEENIKEIHNYLSSPNNEIIIMSSSYEKVLEKAKDGDVIYIDPPYDYTDDDGFTKYQVEGFSFEDFKELKIKCDNVINKNAFIIISNNATERVIKLFEEDPKYKVFYDKSEFETKRTINCDGNGRMSGKEAIFWGMNADIPFPQANDMEKIIKLIMSNEDVLKDKEKAKLIINVETTRQVAYYLSALMFFEYLTRDNKFTKHATEVRLNEQLLREDIFKKLLEKDIFKNNYEKLLNGEKTLKKKISDELSRKFKDKLSESTIERRSSTIEKWIHWMNDFKNKTF